MTHFFLCPVGWGDDTVDILLESDGRLQVISPSLLCPTPCIWKAPSYEAAQCQVVLSNKNEDGLIWDQTFSTPDGGLVRKITFQGNLGW